MDSFRQQVVGTGIPPLAGMFLIGLALGPTLNAVGALGEEIGWRGFLYKELAPLGFWRCSLVTGGLTWRRMDTSPASTMTPMLRLLVNIDVNDIERAVDFYTGAFALTVGRRFGAF